MAGRRVPLRSEPSGLVAWLGAILGSSITLASFALVAPLVPFDPTASAAAALLAYGIGYACTSAVVLFVSVLAPREPRVALGVGVLAAGGLVALAVLAIAPGVLAAAAVLAALLGLGTAAGAGIGGRIQHAGHLSVVAIVSSVADVASVVSPGGPSHEIAESPALLSLLALPWPMLGTARIEPLLGVGDVVFVALYVAAAAQHGLSRARTVVALAGALAVTAVVVAVTALPIPALPFLGAAIVIAHPAARLPPPAERRNALVALVLFFALFGTLVLVRWSG